MTSSNLAPLFIMTPNTVGENATIGIFTVSLKRVCVFERERDRERDPAGEHSFHVYKQLLHTLDVFSHLLCSEVVETDV